MAKTSKICGNCSYCIPQKVKTLRICKLKNEYVLEDQDATDCEDFKKVKAS